MSNLIGKKVLIVDEVDDTRTTLEYAVKELQKDVAEATARLGREGENTQFSIFVLHVSATLPILEVTLGLTRLLVHKSSKQR
jgi:hypoxanthine phosphoribosyltransferase